MSDAPARITASQVTMILQRAAEIDARGDSLTVEELRRIASEAGIDPAATEAAIEEVTAGEEPAPLAAVQVEGEVPRLRAKQSKSPSPAWIVASGAVGTALGFITALPEVVGIPAFGATILYLIVRAVQSMKRGSQLSFQLQNFAVWFGMFVGASAIGVMSDFETLEMFLTLWIVTSGVGGLIVRFGPREEPENDLPRIGPGNH